MFERVVATLLHRYLGKYIQDLDTENLNVGIFGGQVQLTDLKIKPDALYELDLPIEVKVGAIGRINIKIPWGGFSRESVVIEMEEVHIIAAPITDREYDPEKEKRLMRASKRRKLEILEKGNILGNDAPESPTFIENLMTTIMNNLQVFIHNIHIRYEDSVMGESPFACGICLQSISIETTNSKWKPTTTIQSLSSVYQMIRLDSLSIYCNPVCSELVGKDPGQDSAAPYTWRNDMKRGLETFSVRGEEFDFILKPITAKMKVIVNKSNEARVPKLLVDFVLQDAATQLSRLQYLALIELADSFKRININRRFRKFHPGQKLSGNVPLWWKYAYNSVLEQRIRPYTWERVKAHRNNIRRYCSLYKQILLKPTDTELKLDLQQCEDLLTITDIIIGREYSKSQLLKEEPERVNIVEKQGTWWARGASSKTYKQLDIITGKGRGIWAQLSPCEKNQLFDAIGYCQEYIVFDKPKQYIEHKINFTLANCSLSLLKRGHEVLVLTLAQFLASLETRPSAKAFKVSARVESFVIEGANVDHDLIPVITADNIYTGNSASNFLSLDFEKNPLNSEANYGLTINLEPIEVVYHEHAISELISFFQTANTSLSKACGLLTEICSVGVKSMVNKAIKRCSSIDLNLDFKLPYLVVPELGTLQKGGNLAIIDFGHIKVTTELQPSNINLEDATHMELEERLYDRFNIEFNEFQVLFCDAGDVWRDAKKLNDTEFHLLPKLQFQFSFSNSVKPEYKTLPRYKLNVGLTSLKVNISDRKIGSVMDFLDNLPLPSVNTVHVSESSNIANIATYEEFEKDEYKGDPSHEKMLELKIILIETVINAINRPGLVALSKASLKASAIQDHKNLISTEQSDEEIELWARTVDLPGFDDNVSPNNVITMLLRFIVGEVVIQLCRSCNRIDKPYLMLRVSNICCDAALMEYGPAVQASIGGIQLVDKLHTAPSGQYLELIATETGCDLATMLYRKVRADCPDFKSHFHNVEQSLVLDFSSASVVLHREAFVTLNKYIQYLLQKIQNREIMLVQKLVNKIPVESLKDLWVQKSDPPIPPGATKFSYSTRMDEFRLKFCDTDVEFLEMKVTGLESDCLFKANERMVLQFYLASITIEDLSGMTLYPKILMVDDEKAINFKYIRHSPRFYKNVEIETKKDDVKSDGSLKIQIGRIQLVVLSKMIIDLQHFVEPFVKPSMIRFLLNKIEREFQTRFDLLRSCSTKIHLALDFHTPSFLFPQKMSSPDLVLICLGDLKVENFFKEKTMMDGTATPIIDNILIKLDNIHLSRAIMTLAGSLEVQEPVIEPLSVTLDVKRAVNYNDAKTINLFARSMNESYSQSSSPLMLYQVDGVIDNIRINLGQRDLSTILSVWVDNFKNGSFISELCNNWSPTSPSEIITPLPPPEDQSVRKLQAFFYQNEQIRKEASMKFSFEGLQIYLFSDCDEVLSSPMRDMNQGLCKLETGEASLSVDILSDKSLEMKISLSTAIIEDIRKEIDPAHKKILQVHSGSPFMEDNSNMICVSAPPIIDATFKQTQTGDKCIDILVECTRLSLSVSFILDFTRFLLDSLPPDKYTEGGLVNHGYVGDATVVQVKPMVEIVRPPSSVDSTSGYFSSRASCNEEQTGISISLQVRKPEIMIYSSGGYSLLLRTEVIVDFSRHSGRESLVFSLAGLRILSKYQNAHIEQPPYLVLQPCDIEFARTMKASDGDLKITTNVSFIDIHITPSIVHTINLILDELNIGMSVEDPDANNTLFGSAEIEDLWSPKKIVPYQFARHMDNFGYGRDSMGRINEMFTINVPKVRVVFELEDCAKRAPVILIKAVADAVVSNWTSNLQMKGGLQIQASYYNSQIGAWEPFLEPSVEDEGIYRPIEMQIKIFRVKAYLIQPRLFVEDSNEKDVVNSVCKVAQSKSFQRVVNSEESETSADEQDVETGSMLFIRKRSHREHNKTKHESVSMISYPEDSDSENEEGVMEKLANAINHLFTGDSSDGEASDSNDSSGAEPSPDTDDVSEAESAASVPNANTGKDSRPILIKKRSDSIDSGLETEGIDKIATYVIIDMKDQIELTVTPQTLNVVNSLYSAFTNMAQLPSENALTLINDITPNSTVTLLSKAEVGPAKVLITATYEHSDSLPSSPASSTAPTDFFSPVGSDVDGDYFEDGFSAKKQEQGSTAEIYSPYLKFPIEPVSCLYKKVTDHRIRFQIPGFDEMELLCPQRTCDKLHMLQPVKQNTRYYIVLNVLCHDWGQKITLRSPLQVRNETSYAIALYYKKSILESLGYPLIGESTNPFEDTYRIATIEPDETFNVPLTIAHHCKLYIMPAHVDNYGISETALWWQDLAADLNSPKDILCPAKDEKDATVFSTRVICEDGIVTHRQSRLIPNYLIRLMPPLAFHNRLPYAIEIKIPSSGFEARIEAGENTNTYCLNLAKSHKVIVNVPSYLGILWTGSFNLSPDVEEKIVGMATEQDTEGGNKQLGLSMKVERIETCEVILYAPYWIINKTGLPLQIRASLTDVVYEAQGEEPLLFCYRKQRKPCVRLRAYHSSWSSAFSMDAFSTSGLVICKDRERKRRYRILLKVDLSEVSPQLTKMVTLLPNFIISNESKRPLRFMEENEKADLWIDLAPSQTIAFWPETDKMFMFVKYRDSKVVSQHFPIASNHMTVLRMDKGGALCVKVTGGCDRPFSIIFHAYSTGDAPVRVDNLCEDLFLKVHQQQLGQVALLSPYQSMLYTWDDPCKERSLLWNVYNKKSKDYLADVWKDGYGQEKVSFHMVKKQQSTPQTPTVTAKLSASLKRFSTVPTQTGGSSSSEDSESDELQKPQLTKKTRKDKVVVYWVSYLEGPQRVLLFTQDERVAYKTRLKIDSEKSYLELFFSLKGFGLSLANHKNGVLRELAYFTLRDSAPIWEVNVAHRWKPLTLELAAWIEDRWRQDSKKAQMKELVHVDFEKMHMTKPFYGELRRRYIPAAWIQYRKSPNYSYFQAKVHRLQVENQMHNAVFPVVFYPKPLPRTMMRKAGDRPCFQVAILKRQQNAQSDDVYKSIKVSLQEFVLQLDQNFVFNMYDICSPWLSEAKPSVRIRSDITALYQPLSNWCKLSSESKVVIEQIHISPVSIQVNFVLNGSIPHHVYGKSLNHDVVYFIFDTLSASHMEMKGLNLKTTYYERKGLVDTRQNQLSEIISHFTSQLFPQFHVLVFGLDILGNPYSLVTDFTDGLGEMYYEPSFVESPEEYCDGLSTGAQVLIGHIRGPSTTNTLITSGLSDSSILVQFDDDYKKKRRLCCLQQNGDLPLGVVCNSRTFEVSIALGMAGLIIKHQTGQPQFGPSTTGLQQHDGLELFFRSVGKGLLGLLTKPTGGIVDCMAMASDGIKRASEIGDEFVMRSRQPRHMDQYLGVKPYSYYESAGKQLLTMVNKGHYADTDIYWIHAPLSADGRTFLLVTLHHVFLIEKCRLWGTWEVEWGVRVDDIMSVPTIENSALVFKVRQDDNFSYLNGDERTVPCRDKPILQWLQKKIEAVMIINMEDKPCPVSVPD